MSIYFNHNFIYFFKLSAHKNCVLFITHGGMLSTTEAIHFGVPIIAIPARGDQFLNVNRAVPKGFVIKVDLTYNLAEDLENAIQKMIHDQRSVTC